MQNDLLEQWGKLTKTTLEALTEFSEISIKFFEKFAAVQLDAVNTSLEATAKGTQVVSEAKDYRDYLTRQTALAADYSEKFLKIARKSNEIVVAGTEELAGWVQRQVDTSAPSATRTHSARKAA